MQTADLVFSLPTPVDPDVLNSFPAAAEIDLAVIRSGILVYLQDHHAENLEMPVRLLGALARKAQAKGSDNVAARLRDCERTLTGILDGQSSANEQRARHALDLIAEIEALLLKIPLQDDPDFSIAGFLDESFERWTRSDDDKTFQVETNDEESFEIDDETMEIFRGEAADLLEPISANLKALSDHPNDRDALWNIRRCAHTFKGAAGVIGLKDASELAHRVEDLLDQLAEDGTEVTPLLLGLLAAATDRLTSMAIACDAEENLTDLSSIYADFDLAITTRAHTNLNAAVRSPEAAPIEVTQNDLTPVKPAPIVRVALDKLDELLEITRDLAANRKTPAQEDLITRIHERLLQLRMVRFGMLKTRLNRAVQVTCQEENKKAELLIENEDLEMDTQTLDSLVEPLIHLLRNAVVHGIESPERRRLIRKPEKGQIQIRLEGRSDELVVCVSDDGRGLSAPQLREKAVVSGVIDAASASLLSEQEAFEFIFSRGLTTADKLSMNAGRGVGMSIVKESIGSIGGSIFIESSPQQGTTFVIKLPLVIDAVKSLAAGSQSVLNILIVDDSSSVRQMIRRTVEDAGWKAITATDGINAVETLSIPENRPDIILTDLEMPDLNGYELLEVLKNDAVLSSIPVVVVSSRADEVHRQKALELGAVDFLKKPFDGDALIRTIEQYCVVLRTND